MKIKKVGLIAKSHKLKKVKTVKELFDGLADRNIRVYIDKETAQRLGATSRLSREEVCELDLDLMIVLGGDGTLLSVARLLYDRPVPIMGVNMGNLGFLTEFTIEDALPALDALLAGEINFEERMFLDVSILKNGRATGHYKVLNDVVFNKGVLSRLVDLKVCISGQYVTSYRGDGLIIATPTGSTAYSMAAGGPILYPTIDALIVCPICPFSFANRPIVVPGDRVIEVQLGNEHKDFYVTLDGQTGFEMKMEYTLRIQRAKPRLKLIHLPDKNYYEVLRKKLKWGDR